MGLDTLVADLARALTIADGRRPIARSHRGTRSYQPGIGPHSENAAIALALAELVKEAGTVPRGQFIPYPGFPRQKCDLWVGDPHQWVAEIKMARLRGDNGKPDDTAFKDILSPYDSDRSALTDCVKLATSGFACQTAIIIYGFDFPGRPLDPVIDAFEVLAARRVAVRERAVASMGPLVHPVHSTGRVFGWEVTSW